ncbi:MAG: N-acetyl-gamma-glutamyl-phosphate reductase [Clostridiales bacterium]|jgi:N-acetyl-gamma-glutamyl-phosphate reductase|nr:N-acetyl-gamma-glutamyl-phosphate reductase [Clostridiales bacterium]
MTIKAGILGATGYAGVELCRLLLRHPGVELAAVGSVSFEGKKLYEVYPNLRELCGLECENTDAVIAAADVVFAALPHGLSQETAAVCAALGKKFIDLGADFRLDDGEEYQKWYGCEAVHPELHQRAVYGLPELFREEIKNTDMIGNPGCYPTSVALGLAPALRAGVVETKGLVVDAKSGTTGAGRKPAQNTHFPDCNEAFSAYKVASHRHTPEIEQTLSKVAGEKASVTFVPHLLPVNRGILSTIYARLKPGFGLDRVRGLYEEAYKDEYFVRLLPDGSPVNIRDVRCSNFCDIQLYVDEHGGGDDGLLIVTAVIDNMVKGAAGQAIQNMNLLFGLTETAGLDMIPPAF